MYTSGSPVTTQYASPVTSQVVSAAPTVTVGTVRTSPVAKKPQVITYGSSVGNVPIELIQAPTIATSLPVATGNLQIDVNSLMALYEQEREQRLSLQATVMAMKERLDRLDPPEKPLHRAVRQIEERGNIRVNHQTGHVALVKQIKFVPRNPKHDPEPTAVFQDIVTANNVCKDLAEVACLFNSRMTIEGHTKGGESEYWQALANERARVVAQKIVTFGASEALFQIQGRPGRLGKNEVCTEVFVDIANIQEENAAVQEVDVVVGGRVVERDFVQAGRVVERDRIAQTPVLERDVYVGGRLVERDIAMGSRTTERDFVGTNGATVERDLFVNQPNVIRKYTPANSRAATVLGSRAAY